MPTREAIESFLAQKHIAIVGVSRDPKQLANAVYRRFRDEGRTVYPVNSNADSVEGVPCFHSLADVPDPLDGVMIVLPAEEAKKVVVDAVARRVPRVWLHRGGGPSTVSEEAVETCRSNGIEVVDGACAFMFDEPVRGMHRVHRFFSGRRVAV